MSFWILFLSIISYFNRNFFFTLLLFFKHFDWKILVLTDLDVIYSYLHIQCLYLIIFYSFIEKVCLDISAFILFSYQLLKKTIFAHNKCNTNTISIYSNWFSNSYDNFQIYFFSPLFVKLSNRIFFFFFYASGIHYLIRHFFRKIYYFISQKNSNWLIDLMVPNKIRPPNIGKHLIIISIKSKTGVKDHFLVMILVTLVRMFRFFQFKTCWKENITSEKSVHNVKDWGVLCCIMIIVPH